MSMILVSICPKSSCSSWQAQDCQSRANYCLSAPFSFLNPSTSRISGLRSSGGNIIEESRTSQPKIGSLKMNFIDIGCNLLDAMYKGQYNGKLYHENDLDAVLERARAAGVKKIIVTAGNLEEAKEALALCQGSGELLFQTRLQPVIWRLRIRLEDMNTFSCR